MGVTLIELLYVVEFFLVPIAAIMSANEARAHLDGYILGAIAGILVGIGWVIAYYRTVEWLAPRMPEGAVGGYSAVAAMLFVALFVVWTGVGGFAGALIGWGNTHALA